MEMEYCVKKTMLKSGSKTRGRALVAGSLALTLALSPLTAFAAAGGAESDVEAAVVPAMGFVADDVAEPAEEVAEAEAELPVAPVPPTVDEAPATVASDVEGAGETEAAVAQDGETEGAVEGAIEADSADDAATTSVTVYYCEMVHYDDPSFDDPSGFRVLGTATFDGVKVGEEIRPENYLRDIPDFAFFDGWAHNKVASDNAAANTVQLNYFRVKSPTVVNYYAISDGEAGYPEEEDTVIAEVDGESVRFDKMGSYEIESLPVGTAIDTELLAVPLPDLAYVDADKAEVVVDGLVSSNEVNMFYTPLPSALPDEPSQDVPGTQPPNAVNPDGSGDQGADSGADAGDGSSSGASADDDASTDGDPSTGNAGDETVILDDAVPMAAGDETPARTLPQTGDGLLGLILGATGMAAAAAAAGVAAISRRRS